MYIIISIFTFNIIYITFAIKYKKNNKDIKLESKYDEKYEINYKLIKILNIVALILVSKHFLYAISIILKNGFDLTSVRNEVYVGITESGNFIMMFLTRTIPSAVFNITVMIAAIDLYRRRKYILHWAVAAIIINTVTFGGRFLILNFIVYYIAAHLTMRKEFKSKINKKYIILVGIILAGVTMSRGLGKESILDKVILYFAGSFSFLELILKNPSQFGFSQGLTYGYLTFGFIFEPIVLFLKAAFGVNIDVPSYYFNIYVQGWYNIGETRNMLYNNNTTMLYTFLRDFGELGIIIGTMLLAITICICENKYRRNKDYRYFLILVYMYTVIVNSTIMYTLTKITSSLIFILMFIVTKKKSIQIE